MATKKQSSFEEMLNELNEIVERMEKGDISLADSLTQFERGVKLTRDCQSALKDAEQKVSVLLSKNGKDNLTSFNSEDH